MTVRRLFGFILVFVNTSNRTSRELALDDLSLVRTTSIKSNDNSASPRNGSESIQCFGKGFFHHRGKPKHESSAQSSSVSQAYTGDMPAKNAAGGKGIIPSIFSRRKQSRYESAQRRRQDLGLFNFHYVTHTQRNNVCNGGDPVNGAETLNEASTGAFEAIRYPLPRKLSSDSMGDLCEAPTSGPSSRPLLVSHHTAPASEHRQLLRHILPLEKLRKNSPPPRVSSKQSCCQDSTHAINIAAVNRAQINNEFCQPPNFSPEASGHIVDDTSPHGQNSSIQQEHSSPDEKQYCGVMFGARDSTWPLAISTPVSYETLPDVAEEEEHHTLPRRSWLSLASSDSSLQSTQSVEPVPMLPSLAESERPTSGGSETLGGLEIMRFNSTFHEDPQSPVQLGSPTRESWEDLIDICYEQGAEADCDYR
ncbi:hypothetical protein VFPPC_11847 [Pochonia chlamydosporia 170]|uniref:CRIB domain-containing protein n=1 Tax=Pochonia chlamydosporia 170 TaxID=1380566 RepID=A0A179EXP0_METCM|nr:hypothetical protein VFPPC_11847 [Pochonia chlamydosporia 170]OAQ57955.2 hypothetical protein VFPPC_11847 [Pochonia chlamydosporia 170]